MAQPTPVLVGDNSSTRRKIAVPTLAAAIAGLVIVAVHVFNLPVSVTDQTVAYPLLVTVITVALDIALPDRFLAA